jgi:hypothetical protein
MTEHQLGDGPVQADHKEKMTVIIQTIDEFMNGDKKGADREVGIVLLMFPFGSAEGRCNFMSNGADHKDIVALFKEMIARFEGQPETKGTA